MLSNEKSVLMDPFDWSFLASEWWFVYLNKSITNQKSGKIFQMDPWKRIVHLKARLNMLFYFRTGLITIFSLDNRLNNTAISTRESWKLVDKSLAWILVAFLFGHNYRLHWKPCRFSYCSCLSKSDRNHQWIGSIWSEVLCPILYFFNYVT